MATVRAQDVPTLTKNGYPTSDGKPMAETDLHRILMVDLIQQLQEYFAARRRIYVSGNLLMFYVPGNRRRHVSPDVFVVKGVPKHLRINYLVWEEGKGPDFIIELTSSSTRRVDQQQKFALYRDTLQVPEYFLFDPFGDWLSPPLQGYRLKDGDYVPIRPRAGRLPSKELGLHLERNDSELRLYNPATGQWLPTSAEKSRREQQEREQAEAVAERAQAIADQARTAAQRERAARERAEAVAEQAQILAERERAAREQAETELDRLRKELETTRRQRPSGG
jgi:Uma2 family endonuclease